MILWLTMATVAAAISGLRWLRVAQREHYLPDVTRFAMRWWTSRPVNVGLLTIAVAGVAGAIVEPWLGLLVAVAQMGPVGLGLRGRTAPIAWTDRMRRVAALTFAMFLAIALTGYLVTNAVIVALSLFVFPLLVDISLIVLEPVERRLTDKWVEKARHRINESGARVVAITGSYGKTTTKEYLHHLIRGQAQSVASPASFNNRLGLAKAINERLVPGTEVFIAEMGTYGPGEIAEMCGWLHPEISAIVSIGPVHLERFGSEERIVEAKSEILDGAGLGVIAIDHPLLASLADHRAETMDIVTVGSGPATADVVVSSDYGRMSLRGVDIGPVPGAVFATNLAVAVAIVDGLGLEIDPSLFETLPRAEHRQSESLGGSGFTIIDDTFNSNPVGAARALSRLVDVAPGGRKVLVTPGMVELGSLQADANEEFARDAARVCDEIIIVGRTNRQSLLRGSKTGRASVTVVADREEAVEWVRRNLAAGDAVLYENDLPDHYP